MTGQRAVYLITGSCPRTRAEAREEWADMKEADGQPVEAAWYRMTAARMRRRGQDGPQPQLGPVLMHVDHHREPDPVCTCGHLAEYLCDAPVGRGRTCDKPMCRCCRTRLGEDLDHCAYHDQLLGKPVP